MEQRKGPRLPIEMGMEIGIDLGSACTRIAVFDGCHYGCSAMPSYVAFTNLGVLVGEAARKQATENPMELYEYCVTCCLDPSRVCSLQRELALTDENQNMGKNVKDNKRVKEGGSCAFQANVHTNIPLEASTNSIQNSVEKDENSSNEIKDEFVHVRAKRGQATNSHSLAERVRRKKISERMRLLQDLVPGCSKGRNDVATYSHINTKQSNLSQGRLQKSIKAGALEQSLD